MVVRGGGRPKSGYKVDGIKVPSVTTVLNRFKESGALLQWAFQQGKLAEQGLIEHLYQKAEEAADIGSIVHDWIEDDIHGIPRRSTDLNEEDLEKAIAGFEAYERWIGQTNIEITHTEIALTGSSNRYGKDGKPFGYGGTLDALGVTAKEGVLLDWKTSKALYRDHVVQLGAYATLVAKQPDMYFPDRGYICVFSKQGTFSVHEFSARHMGIAADQFDCLLDAFMRDKELKEIVGR